MLSLKLLALLCAATTSIVGQTFVSFPIVTPTGPPNPDLGSTTYVGHHPPMATDIRPIVTPTGPPDPNLGVTTTLGPWQNPPMATDIRPIVTPTGPADPNLGVTTVVDTRPWMDPPVVKAEATSSEVASVNDSTSVKPSTMTGGANPLPSGLTVRTSVPTTTTFPPDVVFSSAPANNTSTIVITDSVNSTTVVPAPTEGPGNKTLTSTVVASRTSSFILPSLVFSSPTAAPGSGAAKVGEMGVAGALVAVGVFFLGA